MRSLAICDFRSCVAHAELRRSVVVPNRRANRQAQARCAVEEVNVFLAGSACLAISRYGQAKRQRDVLTEHLRGSQPAFLVIWLLCARQALLGIWNI